MQLVENMNSLTIKRTLKTAKLFDAFWERWLVHGVDLSDLNKVRPNLQSLEKWLAAWEDLGHMNELDAMRLEQQGLFNEAERMYRKTALYYYLNYWIDPMPTKEKKRWYNQCLKFVQMADDMAGGQTLYKSIVLDDGSTCSGRIRIPKEPRGCVIIINPIDSSKEELFQYEMDFVDSGLVVLSFDGPGQGETFILNNVIGTRNRWEQFMELLIDYTSKSFAGLRIYLFGTSLGASWVLYGSSFEKVSKAVAVSPAVELEKMNMPTYFMDRMDCSCIVEDEENRPSPKFAEIAYRSPLKVFHGNKDMMVTNPEMYNLYNKISSKKELIEYEDEGHCCNNKLAEIRKLSIQWFLNE